jgi:hypothetical protein
MLHGLVAASFKASIKEKTMNTADAIASFEHVSVQERVVGDVRWVALRARGADWSWLTPEEAAELAREWRERYGAH